MTEQLSLFGGQCSSPPREVSRFGALDAVTGLPLRNNYSQNLDDLNFAIYRESYLRAKGASS